MNTINHRPFSFLMKASVGLIILLILVAFTKGNNTGKLKGKVKSMTHLDYRVRWDSIPPKVTFLGKEYKLYDKEGKMLISERFKNSMNLWRSKSVYTYNDAALLVEIKSYSRIKQDTILSNMSTFTYDSLGKRHEKKLHERNDPVFGNTKAEDKQSDSVIIVPNNNHKYDKKGRVIESINYNPEDKSKCITTFKYYANGNRMEMVHAWTGGYQDGKKELYRYDKKGTVIETISSYINGEVNKYKQSWISGNRTVAYHYRNDTLIDKTIDKFTYDKIGNWLVDSIFTNDTLTYIKKQDFEYW